MGDIFHTLPDRHWGPPSLLYKRYRISFPGEKRPGRDINHAHPSSAEVKEIVKLYLYSSAGPWRTVLGRICHFTLYGSCCGCSVQLSRRRICVFCSRADAVAGIRKNHYSIHKIAILASELIHTTLELCTPLSTICFNIIYLSTLRSTQHDLVSVLPTVIFYPLFFCLVHECYIFIPSSWILSFQ